MDQPVHTTSAKPSLLPAILALLILGLFGYLLFIDSNPSHTEHTLPPIEIMDQQQPPLTIIKGGPETISTMQVKQQEAEAFVNNLAPQKDEAINIAEGGDQFVRFDSVISLSGAPSLSSRYSADEQTSTTLANLKGDIEDHSTIITIIQPDGEPLTRSLADLLQLENIDLTTPIIYIGTPLSMSTDVQQQNIELAIKEIIQSNNLSNDALFYVHRVTEDDIQGLWGIIQAGLIDKFREGLQLKGISRNKDFIQAVIPADADEQLDSGLSSFLGSILYAKVDNSYVYNVNTQTMGHNPHLIYPGQQVILIHFSPEELQQIYIFFSDKRNQDIETFAID